MDITVVGTNYVGLVSAACFAEMGNRVTCIDSDELRIAQLLQGKTPLYEPGLDSKLNDNIQAGRLNFSAQLKDIQPNCSTFVIAVNTPSAYDGSSDLSILWQTVNQIADLIEQDSTIITASTVPVGTSESIKLKVKEKLAARNINAQIEIVANPQFLKEGSAIEDFNRPDRIIIGIESDKAKRIMSELYKPFSRSFDKLMFMGVRDAELTKYAANAMLATKISFMNEMANLAERLDVDIEHVRTGIGADNRIGYSYIYPGCGYGGSFFPNDVRTLINMGAEQGYQANILTAIDERNELQKQRLFEKLKTQFNNDLAGKTIAIWGLAFKPGTDDLRQAPSLVLIESLLQAGAKVRAYDPMAMDSARSTIGEQPFNDGSIVLVDHQYDALKDADAMVLVTEWKPFRQPDFNAMKRLMKNFVIIDGRNQYDPETVRAEGFEYSGIGRTI
ncbi:MAG: UDP-glucose/GDP-mannose dehydrogenase family protein [Oleispira sp.]